MRKFVFILFLGFTYSSYSQFTGGKGDGYASVEESIIISGINKKVIDFFAYPNYLKKDGIIHLSIDFNGEATLINVLGEAHSVDVLGQNSIPIPYDLIAGQYVLVIKKDDFIYRTTVMIYE